MRLDAVAKNIQRNEVIIIAISADKKARLILPIYVLTMLFFIGKMLFYSNYVARFPDEPQQISYIAYLQVYNKIIPEFKDMTVLTNVENSPDTGNSFTVRNGFGGTLKFGKDFNYLCHPPLYYQIMRLSGGIHVNADSTFTVDLVRLRLFSAFLAALVMLLIFYIGWSHIGRNPAFHLLYATICISVPMLSYDCAGINNDTLALLAITLFTLGLLRFAEKKRTYGTYILIAAGVFGAFLSKLTAGEIVTVSLALFLIYLIIKERNLKFLISRQFLVSLPFYFVTAAYYLIVKQQTGSFQPSFESLSPQQFFASGHYVPTNIHTMLLREYAPKFLTDLLSTWTGIASHVVLYKKDNFYDLDQIGLIIILILPLFIYFKRRSRRKRKSDAVIPVVGVIYPAMLVTVMSQVIHEHEGFKKTGSLGGYQSRYYLCAIVVIALAGVWAAKKLYGSEKPLSGENSQSSPAVVSTSQTVRHVVTNVLCVVFSALLTYEDFIYFVLNFKNYLK